jgi:ribulose-phosphate 3-epimerase
LSVNPGFGGQAFLVETIGKVTELRRKLDAIGSGGYLEVDGGIAANTLPLMQNAGANVFVCGSAVFKYPQGITAGINALKEAIESSTKQSQIEQ